MREQNLAFKKKLYESKIRTTRRHSLQRACGALALGISVGVLFFYYLR
ncbi:MAG: hypothetical protein WBG17_11500 [Burkholderiaceae bacterium]